MTKATTLFLGITLGFLAIQTTAWCHSRPFIPVASVTKGGYEVIGVFCGAAEAGGSNGVYVEIRSETRKLPAANEVVFWLGAEGGMPENPCAILNRNLYFSDGGHMPLPDFKDPESRVWWVQINAPGGKIKFSFPIPTHSAELGKAKLAGIEVSASMWGKVGPGTIHGIGIGSVKRRESLPDDAVIRAWIGPRSVPEQRKKTCERWHPWKHAPHGRHAIQVRAPDPIPPDCKVWIELKTGAKTEVASFDLPKDTNETEEEGTDR